jgi:hypothetical protein
MAPACPMRGYDVTPEPHWLMIAGTLLVIAGFIGVRVSGNKTDEVDPPSDERMDSVREHVMADGLMDKA